MYEQYRDDPDGYIVNDWWMEIISDMKTDTNEYHKYILCKKCSDSNIIDNEINNYLKKKRE